MYGLHFGALERLRGIWNFPLLISGVYMVLNNPEGIQLLRTWHWRFHNGNHIFQDGIWQDRQYNNVLFEHNIFLNNIRNNILYHCALLQFKSKYDSVDILWGTQRVIGRNNKFDSSNDFHCYGTLLHVHFLVGNVQFQLF